jgi:hypothetical protein
MSWGLVPEIFFDLIARVVAGSLVLLCSGLVYFGPERSYELLVSTVPSANLASLLLFAVVAYFVAIILSQVWDASVSVLPKKAHADGANPDDIFVVRARAPDEAARLLKIQAEKNLCQVVVSGFGILLVVEVWLLLTGTEKPVIGERIAVLVGMAVTIALCWRWRASLDSLYNEGLATLRRLVETPLKWPESESAQEPSPKT